AHAEELDLLAFRYERIRSLARKAHDRRVERSAQAALGGAYQQKMRPFLTSSGQKWRRCAEGADPGSDITQHLYHLMGIGARGLGRSLGAPQLRCRDHLHGLGDLLRRLGGGDAHAHVLETGHGRYDDRETDVDVNASVVSYRLSGVCFSVCCVLLTT